MSAGRAHEIALRYASGSGPRPNEDQMRDLRDNLYNTVIHIDELQDEIQRLRAETTRLRAELGTTSKTATATVTAICDTKDTIIGIATPCGQMLRIVQNNGQEIFATCIMPGVQRYGGKCCFHMEHPASAAAPAASSSTKPGASTYAAVATSSAGAEAQKK